MGAERITIERLSDEDLKREVWEFRLADFPQVWLESYAKQTRSTKKDKWEQQGKRYLRSIKLMPLTMLPLSWSFQMDQYLQQEPKVPDDVLTEVIKKMQSMVIFVPWEESLK